MRLPSVQLSISQKLVGLIVVLMSVIVGSLAIYFPSEQLRAIQDGLIDKAGRYGEVLSRQARSAVAFDDRETAREVLGSLATDRDVVSVTLFGATGARLFVYGAPSAWVERHGGGTDTAAVHALAEGIAAIVPVRSLEGPRGTLIIELSTHRMVVGRRRITQAALVGGGAALAFGTIVAWLIARSLARRLEAVARVATQVTAGNVDVLPVVDGSSDEIGTLTRAFSAMLARLQASNQALEDRVRERTAELDHRNRDLRLVFDHVGQGFVTVDRHGLMSSERSAVLERWIGPAAPTAPLWDYLVGADPTAATWVEVGWPALFDGSLPVDVALAQLPRTMRIGDRHLQVEYTPIPASGVPEQVLVVLSDVTSLDEQARAEAEQQEILAAFEHLLGDRVGFLEFFHEAERLVELVTDDTTDDVEARRWLHTIKGNAGMFGLAHLASTCHALEQRMLDEERPLDAAGRDALGGQWTRFAAKMRGLFGDGSTRRLEPSGLRLARIGAQATTLAERLGKPLRVDVAPHPLDLDPARWAPFWAAFGHLVRNAVDHGIESPSERAERGKPPEGHLAISTSVDAEAFVVRIVDDGRGIEWSQVACRARSLGLPSDAPAELTEALFHDGLSTREAVTELSGRGVGLGAFRAACRARGGDLRLASVTGHGTTIECRFPLSELS